MSVVWCMQPRRSQSCRSHLISSDPLFCIHTLALGTTHREKEEYQISHNVHACHLIHWIILSIYQRRSSALMQQHSFTDMIKERRMLNGAQNYTIQHNMDQSELWRLQLLNLVTVLTPSNSMFRFSDLKITETGSSRSYYCHIILFTSKPIHLYIVNVHRVHVAFQSLFKQMTLQISLFSSSSGGHDSSLS